MPNYEKPYVKAASYWMGGVEITANAEEINKAADVSVQNSQLNFSTVISASAEAVKQSVVRKGDIIETIIFIDLTGLKSVATLGDIIGDTGVSYICQLTESVNGAIFAGYLGCGEVPAGGDDDIDVYAAEEATGAYDGAVGSLTETALMASGGALAVGTLKQFTAVPAADSYLYLTAGAGDTAGTYTAGKIYMVFHGVATA